MKDEDYSKYIVDKWETFWGNSIRLIMLLVSVYVVQVWNKTLMKFQGTPDLQFVAIIFFMFGSMKLIFWAIGTPHIHFKRRPREPTHE